MTGKFLLTLECIEFDTAQRFADLDLLAFSSDQAAIGLLEGGPRGQ